MNEYADKYRAANLKENKAVFIDNPLDVESTAEDLLKFDDIEDDEAEEPSAVLYLRYGRKCPIS